MSQRDELAALIASRRGATARVNETDRLIADRILAAGYVKADGEEVRLRVVGTGLLIGDPWTDVESARDAAEYINAQGLNDQREAVRRLVGPWEAA
ncbi:hypothetical protein [Promicromonospora sukumoe]